MKITQYFTGLGLWGAWFFVFGNLAGAFGWIAIAYWPYSEWHVAACIFGGIAALASVPMMLIGRACDVTIIHIPKDRIS